MTDYEGPGEIYLLARGTGTMKLLAEATNLSVNWQSNNREVTTMHKGLAGRSRGPRRVEINVSTAIPKSGMEVDWEDAIENDRDILIVIKKANKSRSYEGWIDNGSTSQSTDSPAEGQFVFIGKPRASRSLP